MRLYPFTRATSACLLATALAASACELPDGSLSSLIHKDAALTADSPSDGVSTTEAPPRTVYDDFTVPEACGEEGGECLEVNPKAVRLDAADALNIEDIEVHAGQMRLRLVPGTPTPKKLAVGNTLFRGRKDKVAFARVIESVVREGDVVVVGTREAEMTDVFTRGRIKRRIPIELRDVPAAKADDIISVGCARTLIDEKVTGVGMGGEDFWDSAHVTVKLDQCSLVLSGWVEASMQWGFALPTAFDFRLGGGLETVLEASIDIDGAIYVGDEIQVKAFPSIPINVMGLQILIKPELLAGYGIQTSGSVYASAGFDYEASAEVGFGYAKGQGVYPIWESDKSFEPLGPYVDLDGTLSGEVYLKPKLEISLWSVVGGYAALKAFAKLTVGGDATYTPEDGWEGSFCHDLSIGIQPSIGVFVELLLDEEMTLKSLQKTFSGCTEGPVDAVDGCTAEDTCQTNLDCGMQGCRVGVCVPEKGCSCVYSEEIPDCCIVDDDCPTATLGKVARCVNNACTTEAVPGWCDGDDDCNDLDPGTQDTCTAKHRCSYQSLAPGGGGGGTKDVCLLHLDCDDGNPDTADICAVGECSSFPLTFESSCEETCNDLDPMTLDVCNVEGQCSHQPMGGGGPKF